jgi:hypothetical protein
MGMVAVAGFIHLFKSYPEIWIMILEIFIACAFLIFVGGLIYLFVYQPLYEKIYEKLSKKSKPSKPSQLQ